MRRATRLRGWGRSHRWFSTLTIWCSRAMTTGSWRSDAHITRATKLNRLTAVYLSCYGVLQDDGLKNPYLLGSSFNMALAFRSSRGNEAFPIPQPSSISRFPPSFCTLEPLVWPQSRSSFSRFPFSRMPQRMSPSIVPRKGTVTVEPIHGPKKDNITK